MPEKPEPIKYKPFLNKSTIESHSFEPGIEHILLRPNLQSINGTGGYREIKDGKGFGFNVLALEGKPIVAKVENVFIDRDRTTNAKSTHFSWMTLGLGQVRYPHRTSQDAIDRRQQHLENKLKFESVGIKTVEYIGSVRIDSKPEPEMEGKKIPLYVEFWRKLPGIESVKQSEEIEELYKTKGGRDKLVRFALSLNKLSKEGFLCDVEAYDRGLEKRTAARSSNGYPYPRNIYVSHGDTPGNEELIAYDFNLGVDLRKMPWWDKNFEDNFETNSFVFVMDQNGYLQVSETAQHDMEQAVNLYYSKFSNLDDPNIIDRVKIEQDIFKSQISHLFGQLEVSAAILNKVKEIEKALP